MSITKIQKQLEAPPNHPGHVDLFYAVRGRGLYNFCYRHVVMLYLFRSHASPISFSVAYVYELLSYTFHIHLLY